MRRPEMPDVETERLHELKSLEILDTESEQIYDDITNLAARLCKTPIALISLVDEKRQWFKSHHGLQKSELPREISVCAHAILGTEPFVVENALEDERFAGSPLVQGPSNLRFYAGIPLVMANSMIVGTLCVIDVKARKITPDEIKDLTALARQVVQHLEARKKNQALKERESTLRRLYQITSNSELNLEQKIDDLLKLGAQILGVPFGVYTLISKDSTKDSHAGLEVGLSEAVTVNGSAVASLDFLDYKGRKTEVSFEKRKLIQLIAQWVSLETARVQHLEEIEKHQKCLIQSSKMAALGEMSGSIAHEVNNPLAVISGRSQLLRAYLKDKEVTKEMVLLSLDKIDKTVNRITKVIDGLRTFSRNAENDDFNETSLPEMIEDMKDLCTVRLRNANVEVRIPQIPNMKIECRSVQMIQVLMNLLGNAVDAVQELPERWVEISCVDLGDWVQFSVRDSGNGIPADLRQKIMQPFYTTKALGKGTGLGLSISMNIVQAHHGKFYIDENDSHTCFVIEIPKYQLHGHKAG